MFDPTWAQGCKSCSFIADHFDGALPHLRAREVSLAAISRAPLAKIAAFKKRLGWRFPWVSSHDNDFNYDYAVSFRPEGGTQGYNYGPRPFPRRRRPGTPRAAKHRG
jgi:predicted dithiol-disulfide oxidoreductase (DUF899 family)